MNVDQAKLLASLLSLLFICFIPSFLLTFRLVFNKEVKELECFFLSYSPFIITPLWWGPYFITVSSYLSLFIQSLQLLHQRLSLIADIVSIGCSVGCSVVQQSILIPQVREPIFSGYIPFHVLGEYKTCCSSSRLRCLLFSKPFCCVRNFSEKVVASICSHMRKEISPQQV